MKYRDFLIPIVEGLQDITMNTLASIGDATDMSENDSAKVKNYLLALNTFGLMSTLSDMGDGNIDEMMSMFEEATKHATGEEYDNFKVGQLREFAKAWAKVVHLNNEMDNMLSTVAESRTFADYLEDTDNMNDLLDMRNDIDNKLKVVCG